MCSLAAASSMLASRSPPARLRSLSQRRAMGCTRRRAAEEPPMDITGVTPVPPVDDVAAAAEVWAALLGVAPTFVDGQRWAQFDVAGKRIVLAGADRVSDRAGLMIKV